MLRYLHSNGASFFFFVVYVHIFRGLYYGSYKAPREILWWLGVVIYIVMMATAFMGYVLPWGQMSFWGATVITNLFSAIPLVGEYITTWLWGGFAVGNPTLNRFFALHYLLPFVIFASSGCICGRCTRPIQQSAGHRPKGPQDTIPFHPYYTIKDLFGVGVLVLVYAAGRVLHAQRPRRPGQLHPGQPAGDAAHIVPEWYFLPFYAMLRSIPDIWFIPPSWPAFDPRLGPDPVLAALARHFARCARPASGRSTSGCSGCSSSIRSVLGWVGAQVPDDSIVVASAGWPPSITSCSS